MEEAGEGGLGAVLRATGNDMVIPGAQVWCPLWGRLAWQAACDGWVRSGRGVSKRKGCKGRNCGCTTAWWMVEITSAYEGRRAARDEWIL